LEAARAQPQDALRSDGRSATATGGRLRAALVAAEIAVALAVLSAAGLLLRSFARLQGVDPGFLTDRVVTTALPLPQSRYPTPADQARFYGQVVEGLAASGRYAVAAAYPVPFGDGAASSAPVRRENRPASDAEGMTLFASVTPAYFQVLGIPVLAGRVFTEADETGKPEVVVVSKAAVARFWPGEDPIGQRITLGGEEPFTVVGIVGDVRRQGLDQPAEPMVYLSYRQFALPFFTLFARGGPPAALAAEVRAVVRALDPELPLGAIEDLEELKRQSVAQPRFRTVFLGLFAGLGLVLAAVGLYGLVSDRAGRRAREIGIRMALGAERGEVVRLVFRDGIRLALAGGAAGLLASLALGHAVASFLYGVSATDPVTLAVVSLLLLGVAGLASYLPARRAARLDPVAVMRNE
jgi:predicted permease